MDYTCHYDSPLGGVTLASDGEALIGLWFDGQKHFASTLAAEHEERPLPIFDEVVRWLDLYFSGREPDFMPPLQLRTTGFRRMVAEILRSIPYGKTMTYGDIARLAAERRGLASVSAQAVGGAVGHNPISLMVPCHRVVGADGSLTGYAGGIERKVSLLQLEGADMSGFFVPKQGMALGILRKTARREGQHDDAAKEVAAAGAVAAGDSYSCSPVSPQMIPERLPAASFVGCWSGLIHPSAPCRRRSSCCAWGNGPS